jgi:subtilisin-like proprotein convertase family protein
MFEMSVRRITTLLTVTAVFAAAVSITSSTPQLAAGAQQPGDNGIAPSAMAQIAALLAEKETRTPAQRKIDSQLIYARRMQMGVPIAPGVQTLGLDVPQAPDGHVIVDVKARVTDALMLQLNGLSGEISKSGDADLQLHVDLAQIEAIAEQPDVIWVSPQQRPFTSRRDAAPGRYQRDRADRRAAALAGIRETLRSRQQTAFAAFGAVQEQPPQTNDRFGTGVGSVSSQADVTHRSAVLRGMTGNIGAGVKIGVLSDDVCHLADAQNSGDLGAVTVLPGQTGNCSAASPFFGGGDEGTAMLELIHDMAPGAQLYFATAFTSITSFAQNIRDLRTAGCDIIVDDVGYFVETPFQDGQAPSVVSPNNAGVVAQAVKDVAALGAMYFSSAGNSGNLNDGTSGVWEGDFVAGAAAAAPVTTVGTLHRFTGTQDYNVMTFSGSGVINLFWSDPLGASGNDYDLFKLDSTGAAVLSSSTNIQDGNDDPYEQVANGGTNQRIVIVKKATAASRFLHLNTNRGRLSIPTSGQTHGHAATSNPFTFGVAATDASVSFPTPFGSSSPVEFFSSDGFRRIFFNADGSSITPGNVSSTGGASLVKPDVTAADGVSVSGAGRFPGRFFGTSAAAPNAAAVAALIKSANPGFTQGQIRTALLASAVDIEAPGLDRDSGVGIVMAMAPQPACVFTMGPSTPSFTAAGGPGSATVTPGTGTCNWVVFSNVSWITITSSPVGTGIGSVNYMVAPNKGPARTGTIMIQGGFFVTVSQAGAAVAATTFSNNTPVALVDNGIAESPLAVSGLTQPVTNVTVSLYMTHTFDEDLTVSLVAPDGTAVRLAARNGSSNDNYGSACSPLTSRTTFDDTVVNFIGQASAPFVGTFRPELPLSRFNGMAAQNANGTWKLRVQDHFPVDTGAVQCWSLNINQGTLPAVGNDFDGNGAANLTVYRPNSGQWFINGLGVTSFGLAGDIPVPGDYDGNGLTDFAVYRPSTGTWYVAGGPVIPFGRTGDLPVPADYDGDHITDVAVYRTTEGPFAFWVLRQLNAPLLVIPFGLRGDIPMPGDYDGDGRADLAVFRPSTGQWFIDTAASGYTAVTGGSWGLPGDIPVSGDVDNDGRKDLIVFRPSTGTWYLNMTRDGGAIVPFGLPGDVPMTLDVDGDGWVELCLFRPSTSQWFSINHMLGTSVPVSFGLAGDIPVGMRPDLPSSPVSDMDGDGTSDITVFRPSTGEWFTRTSSSGFAATSTTAFGLSGDIRVNGDYDGDRRTDLAVYRPSSGQWFIRQSASGAVRVDAWGLGGDQPVPGDYDGDSRNDLAVWRPSTGEWFVVNSSTGGVSITSWGLSGDQPFARDFDGDGRADLAVYRPSTNQWFIRLTTSAFGPFIVRTWGIAGDIPVPADLDGDGRTEIAVWRPSTGVWFAIDAITGALVTNTAWGLPGDIPQPHDFDGDGKDDLTVFRPSAGTWYILRSSNGTLLSVPWGLSGDQPVVRTGGTQ